uniref:CHK kinase-like domain-containing protein n=1 Tax=Chromera velia CCMP2878 TaxID=1169474 RepID=A0A0G4HXC3_9ALVE|eukprot:Cvel_9257.t1-p1 / transcript=Cvel_9257.t1 / gene=Cvel_9257 / organism=Chromera_velia_CCMP2878 / gene_product=hypothetical protein / transcript_product=hypothetical protein / location=Cvel_scaffold529:35047-36267(+) / protein_length=407 / sequence_SO=supercontig / SO=protein_coding / is_pseudo=false
MSERLTALSGLLGVPESSISRVETGGMLSDMFLVQNEKFKPEKLFVKISPLPETFSGQICSRLNLFEREIKAYHLFRTQTSDLSFDTLVLPQLPHVDASTQAGSPDFQYLAIEDLRERKYKPAVGSVREALSLSQTSTIMKALAEFHAIGYCFLCSVKRGERQFTDLDEVFFTPDSSELSSFFSDFFPSGIEDLRNRSTLFGNKGKQLADRIEGLALHQVPKEDHLSREALEGLPSESLVLLAHGDFFCPNAMMEKREEALQGEVETNVSSPEQCALIDFQWTHVSDNPLPDLFFFLFSSTPASIQRDNFDSLLGVYTDAFVSCVKVNEEKRVGKFTTEQETALRAVLKRSLSDPAKRKSAARVCIVQLMLGDLTMFVPEDADADSAGEPAERIAAALETLVGLFEG